MPKLMHFLYFKRAERLIMDHVGSLRSKLSDMDNMMDGVVWTKAKGSQP
jgi:hypothetical protein